MFECCDCKKIYKEKPDYCDCGNNFFNEIVEEKSSITPLKLRKEKKSFSQQYPQITKFIDSLDILSVCIFIVCIILSILSLIFIKPSEKIANPSVQKINNQASIMPSIDELWVEKNIDNILLSKKEEIKQKNVEKVVSKPSPTSQGSQKQVSQVKKQDNSTNKSQIKLKNTNVVKQESKQEVKPVELQKPKVEIAIVNNEETTKNNILEQEKNAKMAEQLNNYKVALRQALFNNLSVASIVGSGECIIEFSIAQDGKLIDRAFSKQSPNESVNKAVYNMMMKMPYYYAPPEGYNGEKIKLHFLFNNGSYSISYVK